MSFEARAAELFIDFPTPPTPGSHGVHARQAGKLLFVGGLLPLSEGKVQVKGRLGLEVTVDQGRQAARMAVIQGLGILRATLGSLDKIRQFVQLTGYLAAGPEFTEHAKVLDGASQLLIELFKAAGQHARTPVGVASLPYGAALALEFIVEVK